MNSQFLQVAEGHIAYDSAGDGPLVICVPGMGDLRQQYRYLVPQLVAAGFRMVTMDVRGHGETSVGWTDYTVAGVGGDIVALARSLNAGPAVVAANSMAAGAAVWAAAEAPEWVRALVLIDPAVRGEVGGAMRLLLAALFARPWGAAAWLRYYATLFPSRKPADWAQYTAALKRNLSEAGRLESLRRMMSASKAASAARLARVAAPALIVMGSQDPDFKDPAAEARWVAAQVDGACHMIAGAGHYPHTEMPAVTGPHIVNFLQALQPEASLEAVAS